MNKSFNINTTIMLNYIINLPRDYDSNSYTKYPLILFLHGIGERGNDIKRAAEALIKEGANVKMDIVSDSGHELCTKIFEKNEIYQWIINNN